MERNEQKLLFEIYSKVTAWRIWWGF